MALLTSAIIAPTSDAMGRLSPRPTGETMADPAAISSELSHTFVRRDVATDGSGVVYLTGDWVIDNAEKIDALLESMAKGMKRGRVDVSGVRRLDTTGSILIRRYATRLGGGQQVPLSGIQGEHGSLLETISCCPPARDTHPDLLPWHKQALTDIGGATVHVVETSGTLLSFLGLVLTRLASLVVVPSRLRFTALSYQIEEVGFKSMGIVGLISFLIGAVMVNQGAVQLAKFGADIFVIDMVGISVLRELAILLTAIIIAGRSGSAFTAQIGSMKLHEEVDAMETMGMNPVDVLVLPRFMALVIALPLLAFYAAVMGITGGALMAWAQLGYTPANFLFYLREVVPVENLIVGILKAPFFAAVIAISGCYEGFRVEQSAESLGQHVTRSVVQSIFLVIVFDALFAVFFTAVGL